MIWKKNPLSKSFYIVAGIIFIVLMLAVVTGGFVFSRFKERKPLRTSSSEAWVELPSPSFDSPTSLEEALSKRRSVREYQDAPLTLNEVAQMLWAAQGITSLEGLRTAPSAGALYPLEVYLLVGNVDGLAAGVYHYHPQEHALSKVFEGDRRVALSEAALGQEAIQNGSVVIVIAAVFERTTRKYGERGVQYVHMEVGSVAQNIYLQAESLGLGTVFIGAFYDDQVKSVVGLSPKEQPLCLMPVGRK